jgi:hypothetical protein
MDMLAISGDQDIFINKNGDLELANQSKVEKKKIFKKEEQQIKLSTTNTSMNNNLFNFQDLENVEDLDSIEDASIDTGTLKNTTTISEGLQLESRNVSSPFNQNDGFSDASLTGNYNLPAVENMAEENTNVQNSLNAGLNRTDNSFVENLSEKYR